MAKKEAHSVIKLENIIKPGVLKLIKKKKNQPEPEINLRNKKMQTKMMKLRDKIEWEETSSMQLLKLQGREVACATALFFFFSLCVSFVVILATSKIIDEFEFVMKNNSGFNATLGESSNLLRIENKTIDENVVKFTKPFELSDVFEESHIKMLNSKICSLILMHFCNNVPNGNTTQNDKATNYSFLNTTQENITTSENFTQKISENNSSIISDTRLKLNSTNFKYANTSELFNNSITNNEENSAIEKVLADMSKRNNDYGMQFLIKYYETNLISKKTDELYALSMKSFNECLNYQRKKKLNFKKLMVSFRNISDFIIWQDKRKLISASLNYFIIGKPIFMHDFTEFFLVSYLLYQFLINFIFIFK